LFFVSFVFQGFCAANAPTHPLTWTSPGILDIAAPTPYIRDWLTSRLTATLSRLLCGILNQPVSLLFECNI
jgi:hypothetical protein